MQGADEDLFKAMALVHPSFFQPEDADNVKAPVALIPSGGEDQAVMDGFWERIQKKPDVAVKSVRVDFVSSFLYKLYPLLLHCLALSLASFSLDSLRQHQRASSPHRISSVLP